MKRRVSGAALLALVPGDHHRLQRPDRGRRLRHAASSAPTTSAPAACSTSPTPSRATRFLAGGRVVDRERSAGRPRGGRRRAVARRRRGRRPVRRRRQRPARRHRERQCPSSRAATSRSGRPPWSPGRCRLTGGRVQFDGNTHRNLRASGGSVRINGEVHGDAEVRAEELVIGPDTRIGGRLVYRGPGRARGAGRRGDRRRRRVPAQDDAQALLRRRAGRARTTRCTASARSCGSSGVSAPRRCSCCCSRASRARRLPRSGASRCSHSASGSRSWSACRSSASCC